MPSYFRFNPAFDEELIRSVGMGEVLVETAEVIRDNAKGIAHSIMPDPGYEDGIEAHFEPGHAVVANTNHGGHLDEWGSVNNPPYAPLRHAAEMSGARFRGDE